MLTFQSFTTVYDAAEDRIRLTGVSATGEVGCMWFTQRLMNRMILRLCSALEASVPSQSAPNQGHTAAATPVKRLEQEFDQRRAQMAMRPASAVSPPPGLDGILVAAVQLRIGKRAIAVRFKDAQASPMADLILRVTQVRQWLAVLHRLYRVANWSTDPWPVWFTMAQIEKVPPAVRLH